MTTLVKVADALNDTVWKRPPEFSFFIDENGELVLTFSDGSDQHFCGCDLSMTDLQLLQCMLMAAMKERKP